jgi:hypothetical protein
MSSDLGIGIYFWQPELTIFDDPSPLYLLVADPDGPHGQALLIPSSAHRFTDGHELTRRFEDTDRAGNVSILHWATVRDVGEVAGHGGDFYSSSVTAFPTGSAIQ